MKELKTYAVTGIYHGSIISAYSEGEARRIFHAYYNGESILSIIERNELWIFGYFPISAPDDPDHDQTSD
jgi:hypothetical protein